MILYITVDLFSFVFQSIFKINTNPEIPDYCWLLTRDSVRRIEKSHHGLQLIVDLYISYERSETDTDCKNVHLIHALWNTKLVFKKCEKKEIHWFDLKPQICFDFRKIQLILIRNVNALHENDFYVRKSK